MGKRILVVDDEPDIIRLVDFLLTRRGFEVSFATNGREALEMVETCEPDLILLDVMMPGMTGYDVCRQIKAAEVTKKIPVIMLSAKTQKTDVAHMMESGADDFIVKPFTPSELAERVTQVLIP